METSSLGSFTFGFSGWEKKVNVPDFNIFAFDSGYSNDGPPTGKYHLVIEAASEKETPGAELVVVTQRILADPSKTAALIAAGLWEDFCGRGGNSGLWWHGDLKQVKENIDFWVGKGKKKPRLDGPQDLLPFLRLQSIVVEKGYGADPHPTAINPATGKIIKLGRPRPSRPPSARFVFNTPIEEEHGLAVLTDGVVVLGTGYAEEAEPFRIG